jgi:hypothetical protein
VSTEADIFFVKNSFSTSDVTASMSSFILITSGILEKLISAFVIAVFSMEIKEYNCSIVIFYNHIWR